MQKEKSADEIVELFLIGNKFMVNLRGPSAKHFWAQLEQFGAQLEDLGIGDEGGKKY